MQTATQQHREGPKQSPGEPRPAGRTDAGHPQHARVGDLLGAVAKHEAGSHCKRGHIYELLVVQRVGALQAQDKRQPGACHKCEGKVKGQGQDAAARCTGRGSPAELRDEQVHRLEGRSRMQMIGVQRLGALQTWDRRGSNVTKCGSNRWAGMVSKQEQDADEAWCQAGRLQPGSCRAACWLLLGLTDATLQAACTLLAQLFAPPYMLTCDRSCHRWLPSGCAISASCTPYWANRRARCIGGQ